MERRSRDGLHLLGLALLLFLLPLASSCEDATPNAFHCDDNSQCTDPLKPVCVPAYNGAGGHFCAAAGSDFSPSPLDGPPGPPPDLVMPDLVVVPDLCMCASSTDCPSAQPVCGTCSCGPCATEAECGGRAMTPFCVSGACVQCRTKDDCAAAGQACDLTQHVCAKCAVHTDCTTGVCKDDGTCAAASDVLYVDNADGTCKGNNHMGAKSDPFCGISTAIGNLGNKLYVVVAGSSKPYSSVTVDGKALTLLGPGRNATSPANIQGGTDNGINVLNSTAAVVIDGVVVSGSNAGVTCASGATLIIRRSKIAGNNDVGLTADNCKMVTVDANLITGNLGGGLHVSKTTYTVTNNIIGDNSGAPGVAFETDNATGTFAFNTVAGNKAGNNIEGGIVCGSKVDRRIESSIVFGNSANKGTQMNGKCVAVNVVAGMDSFMGVLMDMPDFVGGGDYHLKAGACCKDKILAVDGGMQTLTDHDVDWTHRPQGPGWDIGAHELK